MDFSQPRAHSLFTSALWTSSTLVAGFVDLLWRREGCLDVSEPYEAERKREGGREARVEYEDGRFRRFYRTISSSLATHQGKFS